MTTPHSPPPRPIQQAPSAAPAPDPNSLIAILRAIGAGAAADGQPWPERHHLRGRQMALSDADCALTGYENLMVFAKLYEVPRSERESCVREALEFMGLDESAGKLVRQYSGGMIRRLEIAQCMLHRPPMLFLDEPTVGLDPLARKAVWDRIEQLRAEFGTTILLTTHLMEEADSLCQRVAILDHGKVAVIGAPDDLKASINGGTDPNEVTLDDVFIHYTGGHLDDPAGGYRETARTRRTAHRLR